MENKKIIGIEGLEITVKPLLKDILNNTELNPEMIERTLGLFNVEIKGNIDFKTLLKILDVINKKFKTKSE